MLKYFEMFVNFLWGLPIIVIILGAGIYFTFKTGFFQVFYLKHIFSETILKTIKTGNKGEMERGVKSVRQKRPTYRSAEGVGLFFALPPKRS